MSNKTVFKALSSDTRITILKILLQEEIHITGLAKKIGISDFSPWKTALKKYLIRKGHID